MLTSACVDAVLTIRTQDKPADLHMVEIMEMQHKTATETTLVKGNLLVIYVHYYTDLEPTPKLHKSS